MSKPEDLFYVHLSEVSLASFCFEAILSDEFFYFAFDSHLFFPENKKIKKILGPY